MKKIVLFISIAFIASLFANQAFADWEDHYIYQNMNKVPPPPPAENVPYYVLDDYVEDYYKCMLGVEWEPACTYWQEYAAKNNIQIQSPYNNGMMPQVNPYNSQNDTMPQTNP